MYSIIQFRYFVCEGIGAVRPQSPNPSPLGAKRAATAATDASTKATAAPDTGAENAAPSRCLAAGQDSEPRYSQDAAAAALKPPARSSPDSSPIRLSPCPHLDPGLTCQPRGPNRLSTAMRDLASCSPKGHQERPGRCRASLPRPSRPWPLLTGRLSQSLSRETGLATPTAWGKALTSPTWCQQCRDLFNTPEDSRE